MLPLVFLGPSLARAEAELLCQAQYQPPIRRGDLAALAGAVPRVIGIIDGVFYQDLAVSPNEILAALAAGHTILGAASIGALRAVELGYAGMEGVGRIFEAFQAGEVERDDEVAVTFDPDSGRPLSEPLIGMRGALAEASCAGLINEAELAGAVSIAARLYYPQRTYRAVVEGLGLPVERAQRLQCFLQIEATDLKGEDTRALLRRVAKLMREGSRPCSPATPGRLAPLPPRDSLPRDHSTIDNLPPSPKVSGWTSVRTVTAVRTSALLRRYRASFGVTRVAEVTQLDTLGIPCFSAIAPGTGVSAYSGKSLRRLDARVGAQMEALEAALVHDDRIPKRRATYDGLASSVRAIDPERLQIVVSETRAVRNLPFDWVPGWNIRTGEETWVPANAVFLARETPPWHLSSNGLASGNCLAEALAHALAEVIERDAETLALLATDYAHLPNTLRLIAGRARVTPPPGHETAPDLAYPYVDLATLPGPLRSAVRQVQRAGARIDLQWMASDTHVPAFVCVIHEPHGPSHSLTHEGSGAHPDAEVAARRAITEAAQSRVTLIHGVREDLCQPALRRQAPPDRGWFDPNAPRVSFSMLPSHAHSDIVDDIRFMADALVSVGLDEIVAVDISHSALPFAVVKLIVPGAEAPLDFKDRARVALGWRARRLFDLASRSRSPAGVPRANA